MGLNNDWIACDTLYLIAFSAEHVHLAVHLSQQQIRLHFAGHELRTQATRPKRRSQRSLARITLKNEGLKNNKDLKNNEEHLKIN